jgi:uncharacterized repeat protein (TIGR01451 family)
MVISHAPLRVLTTAALLTVAVTAHNLDTTATSISFADDFVAIMAQRAAANDELIQQNDEFWVLLKTTPGPGTQTGVGGYQTFYIPNGIIATDAAYVFPDSSDPRGFRSIPMKGQSPIAVGNGSISPANSSAFIGWTLPGVNGLGVKHDPVTSSGSHRGTLAGVYADTGIFYSTDPRTAFNSYGASQPPLSGGTAPMRNNAGDTVGEWYANNIADAIPRQVLGVMTEWDSQQLRAFGRADVPPLLDSNGRGNAPWGLANVVAGPESGYAWEFDYSVYQNTVGTSTAKLRAAIKIGPWNRIRYPGSQISSDQPGLISNVLGQAGVDASLMGIPSNAIPPDANAIRFAIGQLELGRPEFAAVKVRIIDEPAAGNCWGINADAFGGDAGGTDGGKDHIWRYFDPTVVTLTPCTFIQKVASKALVSSGEVFHYDITFANNGTLSLPNVTITDVLPSGLNHVSAVPTPSSGSGSTYVWNVGTVDPGEMITLRQYVRATGNGTLFNTATARSDGKVIGVAKEAVEVGVRAILDKRKSVTPTSAAPGETVAYTLEIENIGTGSNGTPLRVREFLPPGFTYQNLVSASLNGAAISSPTITIDSSNSAQPLFTIGQSVKPGKKLLITFNALIGPSVQPGTYWNSFQLEFEGKVVPPIPEAPVEVGGARIGDTVFLDWDGDGTQDAGEPGMQGVTVTLFRDADGNGSFETLIGTRVTDGGGVYLFTGLAAGSYQVSVPAAGSGGVPSGYALTADPNGAPISSSFNTTLVANQSFLTADFGYRPSGAGSIGDMVFEDLNKNGIWNAGEPGIANVSVQLYVDHNNDGIIDAGDLLLSTTTTNGSGVYSFTTLDTTRKYLVRADVSDADIAAFFNTKYGSGANQLTSTNPFAVNSGFTTVTTADFGFWRALPASIGDQVFIDHNTNGIYDAGDAPLGNVTVNLYAADGVTLVATTTSDVSGHYLFDSVAAGTFVVRVDTADGDIPGGFSASVLSFNPTVAAGASFLTADFPFISVFNKQVNKASAMPGELLTYTMTPYWPGPALLTNAQVRDNVPAGTTFTSAGQGGALSGLTGASGIPGSHPGSPGSGSVTLTASKDTSIDSLNPTLNYGASTSLAENRGGGNTLGTRQILTQFDLSSIPAGASITSAQFRMTKTDSSNPAINFQIYPLLKSWTEGTANGTAGVASFNQRNSGTAWTGAGTAFNSLAPSPDFGSLLAETTVNGAGTYTWSAAALLSQVQSWYSTPANNFGLVLGCNGLGTTDTIWNSRESTGTKPELVVGYTATAVPSTTTAISVSPSSVLDSGAGTNVTVSMTVTASGGVSNISPSALTVIPGSNGATATFVSGPTGSPASIGAGGGSATFTWIYKVFKGTAEDQVRFSGAATGTGATFNSATSNGVVVKDAAAATSVIWNLGSNSAAVNGSHAGTSGSVDATIPSTKSTWNYQDRATNNYGADPALVMESNSPFLCHSFVEFDLASIPAGATINSATLRLVHSNLTNAFGDTEAGSPFTVGVRRLTRSWVEGTALNAAQAGSLTWSSAGSTAWTTAGADFAATNYGSFVGGASDALGTIYSVNVMTLVNEWYQGTQANNGLVLVPLNNPGSGDHFFSVFSDDATNSANRPQLLVTYTPASTPATTTAISVSPVLVTASGGGTNVNVSMTVTATGAVTNITPPTNLTIAGTGGASATRVSGPTGSPASIAAGGGSATFTWVYQVTAGSTPGQVTFAGSPTGTGASFGAATSHGLIVTPPLTMTATVNTPPGVNLVNNIAQFYNGPTFLAEDNAITSLTGSIGDYVWADADADGVQDSGEFGISGVTVRLYGADGVTQLATATTDSSGLYRFYGLGAGNYVVGYDVTTTPSGYFGSTPSSLAVALAASQQFDNADFGLAPIPVGTGSIGDYVWIDADNDGVQDAGELPLQNAHVTLQRLINGNWTVVGTSTTGTDGLYSFSGLSSGSYRVSLDPNSQIASPYAAGAFPLGSVMSATFDRDGTGTPHVSLVTLSNDSSSVTDADFGYNWNGSIGDLVWWDYNSNGLQDEIPTDGVANARVQLYHDTDNDGVMNRTNGDYEILRVFTDASGFYQINHLPPGNYIVDVYEDSITTDGIRDTVPTTADNVVVDLVPGNMNVSTADFGYYVGARVEALIFWDANQNAIRDPGEDLLPGVTVTLSGTDQLGAPVSSTGTSSGTGYISFLVPQGGYTISYSTSQLNATYPALGTPTTGTSFAFTAVSGEDGLQRFDFGVDNTGVIGDTIFADLDGISGVGQGPGASDVGLEGVTVNLYLDQDGDGVIDFNAGDELLSTALTDASGHYKFTGLPDTTAAQRYMVQVLDSTLPSAYQQSASSYPVGGVPATGVYSTTLANGESILTADFGYPLVLAVYRAISGTVYHDNGAGGGIASNGVRNVGEPGIANVSVTIEIDADANGSYDQSYLITTDVVGAYGFSAIPNGANVRITVNSGTLPSAAFVQTGDPDGAPISNVWNISSLQANASDIDFGYVENLGSIAGTVVVGGGNGIADPGETQVGGVVVTLVWVGPDLIPGTSDDVTTTTSTDGTGAYGFSGLLPGLYEITTAIPPQYFELADRDGLNPNSIHVSLLLGQNVTGRDFEYQASTLAGIVRVDTNANGQFDLGEPSISGVTVFADLDGDGSRDSGEPSDVTDGSGAYAFGPLPSGNYQVRIDSASLPAGSVASYDPDGVGSPHLATVSLGINENRNGVDFGYYRLGSISGTVWSDSDNDFLGDTPIEGVILSLIDGGGSPVLDGGNPVTTTTAADGTYSFTSLRPGEYGVVETQPAGFVSLSDKDGGNPDEIRPISVVSGATNGLNDFVEMSSCPDTWADWKQLHPGETAPGNPDADAYDNFAEFSFAMPYDSGVASQWLDGTAWIIRPSTLAPGTIEGVFIRPKGAPLNVTYMLQYAATPGDPTVWQELAITLSNSSTVDNGDCTETVTVHNLEAITGLTAGVGVVRIKAVLDEDSGPGDVPDGDVDHVSLTEPEGWTETRFGLCCQTYNVPYLHETVFTGTIGAVNGQSLSFTTETELSGLLDPGASYFVEVTSGDHEGQRFDVVSASGQSLELALDTDIHAATAPFNTLAGAPPASLAGDGIAVRRHRTLAGLFPPVSFGATGSQSTADQVQIYVAGAWRIHWLYDEGDADANTARWVLMGDSTMANQGGSIIPPGQGMFFNNRTSEVDMLAYGEVRTNDFIRPLQPGNNLVGGGYPIGQSAAGTRGREMNPTTGFFGSRDFKTADSFFLWNADAVSTGQGYSTYFLLNSSAPYPVMNRWAKVGDATLLARDSEVLFLSNRAAMVRSKNGINSYTNHSPWSP